MISFLRIMHKYRIKIVNICKVKNTVGYYHVGSAHDVTLICVCISLVNIKVVGFLNICNVATNLLNYILC